MPGLDLGSEYYMDFGVLVCEGGEDVRVEGCEEFFGELWRGGG